ALAVYQAAADLSQQTFFADKSKMFAFNHASRIHRYMADIYVERGDWQKYLECSEWSVNWIKQNRESWVLWNGGGPPTTTYYQMRVSIGLNRLGHKDAATANMDQAVNECNQQLASHENHGEDIIYANDFQNPAADFYVETGQINKAVAIWDRYIAMIDPFVTRNPQDTSSLGYLAYAYERKGDALAIYQQENEGFAQTNISNLRTALSSYSAAMERRQRILQLDPTNQSHINAEKGLEQKISRLKSRIS